MAGVEAVLQQNDTLRRSTELVLAWTMDSDDPFVLTNFADKAAAGEVP